MGTLLSTLQSPRDALQARRLRIEGELRDAGLAAPADVLSRIRRERRKAPDRLFLAQAEALFTARSAGWGAAAPLFGAIEAARLDGRPLAGPTAVALLAPPKRSPAAKLAVPVARRSMRLPAEMASRIIVYTVVQGIRPSLSPIFGMPKDLRFLCFTDQEIACPGWEIRPIEAGASGAMHKICPHKVLGEAALSAEWSLYLAPDRLIMGNLHTLFARWLLPEPLVLWRNSQCIDWQDLAERHLVDGTAPVEAVLAQAEACAATAVPRDRGVHDTRFLWRRHGDPGIAAQMEAWWAYETASPGADDMTLYRALHEQERLPALMPEALGSADANIFFGSYTRPPLPSVAAPASRRSVSGGLVPVTFLYCDRWADHSITLLRGRQLSRMVDERFPDRYEVSFTPDITAVRDQVVIANRSAIQGFDVEALAALKARNVLLISDWQDLPIMPAKNRLFDAHMTLSPQQTVDMSQLYPETPVFYVTHHVNPDVPRATPPADRLRTAFFGLLDNTVLPGTLSDSVDLISVTDAAFTARHWQEAAQR